MPEVDKPMEVKELKAVRNCRRLYGTPAAHEVAAAESLLVNAWEKDQATHAGNLIAMAHNKEQRGKIIAIMTAAGVADDYLEQQNKPVFGRLPRPKRVAAGYLGDLRRTFPVTDGFDNIKTLYESLSKEIAEHKQRLESARTAVAEQQEEKAKRRKADLALASIVLRHGLPDETDWPDALDALRKKDKYLDLAIAGQDTRGDWSEGGWRVEAALRRFTIESDQDKNIAADLCGCLRAMGNGDTDGRTFRDTEWNYDKLFLLADPQLVVDARKCMENING